MIRALERNQEVADLHKQALDTVLMNADYEAGHYKFAEAAEKLGVSISLGNIVQRAQIYRDDSFTYAREGVAEKDPVLFEIAETAMRERSLALTGPFVSAERKFGKAKRERSELWGEHGATLGLLGRITLAKQAVLELIEPGNKESIEKGRDEQSDFGDAHKVLSRGANGYDRVRNAMGGALAEVINTRPAHALPWLGRAAYGLAWTAVRDHHNFVPAVKAIGNTGRHLYSRKAALKMMQNPQTI